MTVLFKREEKKMSVQPRTIEELTIGLENALREIADLKEAAARSGANVAANLPADLPGDAVFRTQFEALLDFKHRYDEGKAPAEDRRAVLRQQAADRAASLEKAKADAAARDEAFERLARTLVAQIERGFTPAEQKNAWDREVNGWYPGVPFTAAQVAGFKPVDPAWTPPAHVLREERERIGSDTVSLDRSIGFTQDGSVVFAFPNPDSRPYGLQVSSLAGVRAGEPVPEWVEGFLNDLVRGDVDVAYVQQFATRSRERMKVLMPSQTATAQDAR